jgi:DnaJ-class molecular chaperone
MPKSSGNFMVDAEDNSTKHECDYCNGTGEIADKDAQIGTRECPECEGRGYWWN